MFRFPRRLSASAASGSASTPSATVVRTSCPCPSDIIMDHMYEDNDVEEEEDDDDDEPTQLQRYLPSELIRNKNNNINNNNAFSDPSLAITDLSSSLPTTASGIDDVVDVGLPSSSSSSSSTTTMFPLSPQRQRQLLQLQTSNDLQTKKKTPNDTEKPSATKVREETNEEVVSIASTTRKKLVKVERTLKKHGKSHPDYTRLCQKRDQYKSTLAKLDITSADITDKDKNSSADKDTTQNGSTASNDDGSGADNIIKSPKSPKKKNKNGATTTSKLHHHRKLDKGDHSHSHTHSNRTAITTASHTATSSRKVRTAPSASAKEFSCSSSSKDDIVLNGHESFATYLSTDTPATVPETPFPRASGGDDDSISLLNSPAYTMSTSAGPGQRSFPSSPPLTSPYSPGMPLVLAQEHDEVADDNDDDDDDEEEDKPLFCKLYQKVAITSLSNGASSLVHDVHTPQRFLNIGFVMLPSRLRSTFKDARQVMEEELVPDAIDFEWKFVIPSLGPVSQKQEAMFGPLLSQEHQQTTTSSGNGNGSERSYNTLTSHTYRSTGTQRTAMTAGGTLLPKPAVLGSLENPLQLVIVDCGPRKIINKTSSSKTEISCGSNESHEPGSEAACIPAPFVESQSNDKDMTVSEHDKRESVNLPLSLTVTVSEDEKNECVIDDDEAEEESMDRGWKIIKPSGSTSHRSRLSTSIPHTISGSGGSHEEEEEDDANVLASPMTSPSASSRKSVKRLEAEFDDHYSTTDKTLLIHRNNSQDSDDLDTPLLDSLLASVDKKSSDNDAAPCNRTNDDNDSDISVVKKHDGDSTRGVMELLRNLQDRALGAGMIVPVAETVDEEQSSPDPSSQVTQNDADADHDSFVPEEEYESLKIEAKPKQRGHLDMYLRSKTEDLSEGDGGDTEIFSVSCDARAWLQYKKERKQGQDADHADSDDDGEEDENDDDDSGSCNEEEARRWISTMAIIVPTDEDEDEEDEEMGKEPPQSEEEHLAEDEDGEDRRDPAEGLEEKLVILENISRSSSSLNAEKDVDLVFESSVPSLTGKDDNKHQSGFDDTKEDVYLDDETATAEAVAFDESESESDEDEILEVVTQKPKLLMLVTLYSGNREIMPKQKRAQTMLESCGLEPVIIDGSDPAMRERRNELFDIAGELSRGQYPLFFKDDGHSCYFVGNFECIDEMKERGTLPDILSEEGP